MARITACSTPTVTTVTAVIAANDELIQAYRVDPPHAGDVDELDADDEHDRRQDRIGQVLEWLGEEQEDDEDDAGGGECRQLGATAGMSTICVLVGLPLTTNASRQTGRHVRHAQAEQVHVLGERLPSTSLRTHATSPRSWARITTNMASVVVASDGS